MEYTLIAGLAAALFAVVILLRWRTGPQHSTRREEQLHAAMGAFDAHRTELVRTFLTAATATGKPRGLRWKAVELAGPPTFAVDPAGVLYALVGATISFEAIEGGDMEDVEAVGNLRSATVVFVHRHDDWSTDGRVIFNLEPAEALQRFEASLQPVL